MLTLRHSKMMTRYGHKTQTTQRQLGCPVTCDIKRMRARSYRSVALVPFFPMLLLHLSKPAFELQRQAVLLHTYSHIAVMLM